MNIQKHLHMFILLYSKVGIFLIHQYTHIHKQVNPNGEFRMNSKCAPPTVQDGGTAPYGYWNIEVNKASNSDWTFFAVNLHKSALYIRKTILQHSQKSYRVLEYACQHGVQ